MEGKRLGFILLLVALFIGGVFQADRILRKDANGSRGDSATIRGVVETTLPSGKVIVVRRDDKSEVLLSLSEAYTITDELGEDLFYSDVKPGMTITAAGIRGVEDNVVIPSLVTVSLVYAAEGVLSARIPSFDDNYFSVIYDEALWEAAAPGILKYRSIPGCVLTVAKRPSVDSSWKKGISERKFGGNIFIDERYSSEDEQKLRVLTIEDPGERYGLPREVGGSVDFSILYDPPISGSATLECTRAVDKVVGTFLLRSASENILLVEPRLPVRVKSGEKLMIRGAARAFDGILHLSIVNESGTKILNQLIPVERARGSVFGVFQEEVIVPRTAQNRLALRISQFSPTDGSVIDTVQLPLAVD